MAEKQTASPFIWLGVMLVIGALALGACSGDGGGVDGAGGGGETGDSVDPSGSSDGNAVGTLDADDLELVSIGTIDLIDVSLSPDGLRVVGLDDEFGTTEDGTELVAWCVVELATDDRSCVSGNIPEVGGLFTNFPPVWHPDGEAVAFTALGDIYLFDFGTGTVTNVTDDGFVDQSPDGIGNTDSDVAPAWASPDTLAFMRTGVSNDGWTNLVDITLDGTVRSSVPSPSFDYTRGDEQRHRAKWMQHWLRPLVLADGTVVVSGEGELHRVLRDRSGVEVLGDYNEEFAPYAELYPSLGSAMPDPVTLPPVASLGEGRFLLFNQGVRHVINNGHQSGGPSGLFLYDAGADELTPILETSPRADGWIGPVAHAVSPDNRLLFFAWRDPRVRTSQAIASTVFSVIDLANFTGPVNPHDLDVLYRTDDFVLTLDPLTWAPNNRIVVNFQESAVVFEAS
ncbi:MAG: hypothetical protein R8F63_00985 [Acidimicrobiales bacterium]|nr:hypothetical protein [Acidimicrobiales bacterium]